MIRLSGGVAVVLIIVLGVLLYNWTNQRRNTRRVTLELAQKRASLAEQTIASIRKELVLQDQAGTTDLYQIHTILNSYDVEQRQPLV